VQKTLTIKFSSIVTSIIFLYMIIYEWGVFESISNTIIYPIKMLLPLALLLFPIKKYIGNHVYFNNFILCYFLFILWSLVPSLFGGNPEDSIEQWLKFLSRFIFCVLASRFLLVNESVLRLVMKAFVITGLFSFLQYIAVWFFKFTGIFSFSSFEMGRGIYFGPYGILGNVGSAMSFPSLGFIYRFHGFWLEPSRASGFMIACYFLSMNLFYLERKIFWKRAAFVSLIAGFLCFSNAGYLAIGVAMLFGFFMNFLTGKASVFNFGIKAGIAGILVFLALFGRTYVAENFIEYDIARAVAGVRGGSCAGTTCGGVNYSVNPSDGRLVGYKKNLSIVNEHPLGLGIRVTGKNDKKTGLTDTGGNAIIQWLLYTGYIGLFILLLRELQVFLYAIKYVKKNKSIMYLTQAWIALFIQNLLYGNIMTPAYLLIIIFLFATKRNIVSKE
jgi:hypothetical protein